MSYALTPDDFSVWLDGYKQAWEQRDAEAAAALFTEDATYRETPYDEPMRGRAAIAEYWAKTVAGQSGVTFRHEVIACTGSEGVAWWHAAFTGVPGGEAIDLDGIFRCRFAGAGQVAGLEEWWHLQVLPAGN